LSRLQGLVQFTPAGLAALDREFIEKQADCFDRTRYSLDWIAAMNPLKTSQRVYEKPANESAVKHANAGQMHE